MDKDINKPTIDWEKIEGEYRAGIKTLREIALEHGITHGAINKRAKKEVWDRDLSAKIKARADALVSKRQYPERVSRVSNEKEIVEANAQAVAGVDLSHRSDVRASRGLVQKLFAELEAQVDNEGDYRKLRELLDNADTPIESLMAIFKRTTAFAGRVDSAKKLAETLKSLVELERKIYKIDTESASDSGDAKNLIFHVDFE